MKTEKILEQACKVATDLLLEHVADIEEAIAYLCAGEKFKITIGLEFEGPDRPGSGMDGKATVSFIKEKIRDEAAFKASPQLGLFDEPKGGEDVALHS